MIRAYQLIDQSEGTETYQYTTACAYWLYGSFTVMLLATFAEVWAVVYIVWPIFAAYYLIVFLPAVKDARKIRAAIKDSGAELWGSRWSFKNPLTVKIRTESAAQLTEANDA